jgi:hypothetical protein|tara:strand:+ start:1917 stop:2201 length:285 start_codon:yes stop_codon:yes gene_type:complete
MIHCLTILHEDKKIFESITQDHALGDYKFLNAKSPSGRPCIVRARSDCARFTFGFADEGKLLVLFRDREAYETASIYFHMLKDEMNKESDGYAS